MQRIKIVFSFEGTNYFGYQIQPKDRTVQQELDKALSSVFQTEITSVASGRTDRGVHALHQVAHFDVETTIPIDRMRKVINGRLPEDIIIRDVELVKNDFHARYDSIEKTYCYMIDNNVIPSIFKKRFYTHVEKKLAIRKMREASEYLLGTHDFTSFCCQKTDKEDKVRTIYSIQIQKSKGFIKIYVTGNGFLYNMVRIIAGALIEVGKGRIHPIDILTMLESKKRIKGLATAPAHGLTLWNVKYNEKKHTEALQRP